MGPTLYICRGNSCAGSVKRCCASARSCARGGHLGRAAQAPGSRPDLNQGVRRAACGPAHTGQRVLGATISLACLSARLPLPCRPRPSLPRLPPCAPARRICCSLPLLPSLRQHAASPPPLPSPPQHHHRRPPEKRHRRRQGARGSVAWRSGSARGGGCCRVRAVRRAPGTQPGWPAGAEAGWELDCHAPGITTCHWATLPAAVLHAACAVQGHLHAAQALHGSGGGVVSIDDRRRQPPAFRCDCGTCPWWVGPGLACAVAAWAPGPCLGWGMSDWLAEQDLGPAL